MLTALLIIVGLVTGGTGWFVAALCVVGVEVVGYTLLSAA